MKTLYKTLQNKDGKPVSAHGDHVWEVGKWYKHEGDISMRQSGFHASEKIFDAMGYVAPEYIAQVVVKGKHDKQKDKQVWRNMKIVKLWEWDKEDSVRLAIYSAELVLGIFEKAYPDDKRPREAIEAAKVWLDNPTARAGEFKKTKLKIEKWLMEYLKTKEEIK